MLPGGEAEAARGRADVAGEEAVHQQGVSEWLGAGLDEGERHPGVSCLGDLSGWCALCEVGILGELRQTAGVEGELSVGNEW